MPEGAVLLFEDETILRLFPVLRKAWSLRGEQAVVPITGSNAKRVLFGTLNLRTGHRIVFRSPNMRQEHFQSFLRLLRRSYPRRPIWLLLDEAPCHIAPRSQALAEALNMVLIWLPKQCSELDLMICTACKSLSLLIYATIAPNKKSFGTIGCNANHIKRHGSALARVES
jgi:hypothetical protein